MPGRYLAKMNPPARPTNIPASELRSRAAPLVAREHKRGSKTPRQMPSGTANMLPMNKKANDATSLSWNRNQVGLGLAAQSQIKSTHAYVQAARRPNARPCTISLRVRFTPSPIRQPIPAAFRRPDRLRPNSRRKSKDRAPRARSLGSTVARPLLENPAPGARFRSCGERL